MDSDDTAPRICLGLTSRYFCNSSRFLCPETSCIILSGMPALLICVKAVRRKLWVLTPLTSIISHVSRNILEADSAKMCPFPCLPGNRNPSFPSGRYFTSSPLSSSITSTALAANLPLVLCLRWFMKNPPLLYIV